MPSECTCKYSISKQALLVSTLFLSGLLHFLSQENVKMEDKRAQENTQRAREMWAESMSLKKEVEGMMAAQELQAKERVSVIRGRGQ